MIVEACVAGVPEQVPQDMQGGQFRIWDPRRYDWRILQSAELPPPSEQFELKARLYPHKFSGP